MNKLNLLIAGFLMIVSLQGVAAEMHNHDPGGRKDMPMPTNDKVGGDRSVEASRTDAEVRKIDQEQGKITLKHGEIKNLGMPGMTMVFKVKDLAMLNDVVAGDRVTFTAERINGVIVVTSLEKIAKSLK